MGWECLLKKRLVLELLFFGSCSVRGSDNAPPISAVTISATSVTFSPTFPGRTRASTLVVTNTGQLPVTVSLSVAPAAPYSL